MKWAFFFSLSFSPKQAKDPRVPKSLYEWMCVWRHHPTKRPSQRLAPKKNRLTVSFAQISLIHMSLSLSLLWHGVWVTPFGQERRRKAQCPARRGALCVSVCVCGAAVHFCGIVLYGDTEPTRTHTLAICTNLWGCKKPTPHTQTHMACLCLSFLLFCFFSLFLSLTRTHSPSFSLFLSSHPCHFLLCSTHLIIRPPLLYPSLFHEQCQFYFQSSRTTLRLSPCLFFFASSSSSGYPSHSVAIIFSFSPSTSLLLLLPPSPPLKG